MGYELLVSLLRTAKEYGKNKSKSFKLNSTESAICMYIDQYEPVTQEMIAKAYLMDKTTIAKSVKQLEIKGYIRRESNPANRRENLLYLEDLGKEDVIKIRAEQEKWFHFVTKDIDESELNIFYSVAEKMLTNANNLLEGEKQ